MSILLMAFSLSFPSLGTSYSVEWAGKAELLDIQICG